MPAFSFGDPVLPVAGRSGGGNSRPAMPLSWNEVGVAEANAGQQTKAEHRLRRLPRLAFHRAEAPLQLLARQAALALAVFLELRDAVRRVLHQGAPQHGESKHAVHDGVRRRYSSSANCAVKGPCSPILYTHILPSNGWRR